MDTKKKGAGSRRWFGYDCGAHSGGEHIGFTLDLFTDSARLDCVARNERQVLDRENRRLASKGVRP